MAVVNIPELFKQPPVIERLDIIAEPEKFSAPILPPNEIFKADIYKLDRAGESYDLSRVPQQFHAPWRKAFDHFTQNHGASERCDVFLSQGLTKIGSNLRSMGTHVDKSIISYPEMEDDGQKKHYMLSDEYRTQYPIQAFDLPKALRSSDPQRPKVSKAMVLTESLSYAFSAQVDPATIFVPEPHEMISYKPWTAHCAQIAREQKYRTMMLTVFF